MGASMHGLCMLVRMRVVFLYGLRPLVVQRQILAHTDRDALAAAYSDYLCIYRTPRCSSLLLDFGPVLLIKKCTTSVRAAPACTL